MLILDLGLQPVSNRFLRSVKDKAPRYPLRLVLQKASGHLSLDIPFPTEELKPRYDWLTCFEPESHLDNLVEKIIALPNIDQNSVFAGYCFKDDSTLERLKRKGYSKQWRIDPKADLGVSDTCASVETFQSAFTFEKAKYIRNKYGYANIMIVRHVIEHANNLSEFIHNINLLVDPSGYIVWELPDCERSLNEGDCTTIWEEHIHYFTSTTFKELLHNSGFSIIDFESVSYPLENSIIALVNNSNSIEKVIKQDRGAADEGANRAYQFAQKITQRKKNIRFILEESKKKYGRITMFGAGHFSVAFISIMEIEDLIDFVIDDNPNKKGLIMPVGGLEIKSSDSLYNQNVGLCLLGLNPQNQPLVLTKHKQFIKNGGKFTSIFPGTDNYLEKII